MTNKLICVEYRDGSILYCDEWEYQDVLEMAGYMQIDIKSHFVEEKMYRITWYDELDEEWSDIWSNNEVDFEKWLKEVKDAGVEYRIREYN
jgi:hypothetical protein